MRQVFLSDYLVVDTTYDFGKPDRDDIPAGGDIVAQWEGQPNGEETDTGPDRGEYHLDDHETEGSQKETCFTQ